MKTPRTLTTADMQVQVKQGVGPLPASRYRDGTPMYPGRWLFTWIKPPHMPWMLTNMTPHEGE